MHRLTGLLVGLFLVMSFAAAAADAKPQRTRVAILMFDGVQIIDFAAPYEVFGHAGFEVFTISADGKPVTTAMDLGVNVDYSFANAPPADILLVPGGDVGHAMEDQALLKWIRARSEASDYVMSVCTGSLILASGGLLEGKSATTFHRQFDSMAKAFPDVKVVRDQRWVESGKIITSAGLASGIDTALHLVSKVRGLSAARQIAMHMEYEWSPTDGFVRGRMADTFHRDPAGGFAFPEGTVTKRVFSMGDEKSWELRYEIESPWTAQVFLAHVRERAGKDDTLQVLPSPDPLQAAWQYASPHGGRWRSSYAVTQIHSPGKFQITGKIERLD